MRLLIKINLIVWVILLAVVGLDYVLGCEENIRLHTGICSKFFSDSGNMVYFVLVMLQMLLIISAMFLLAGTLLIFILSLFHQRENRL